MSEKASHKKPLGIVLALVAIALSYLIPASEALSRQGILAMAIMLGAVAMWVLESLPAGITGLVALIFMVIFNITDMGSAFAGFGNSVVYFTIAIFSLSVIIMKSSLGFRITALALRWAKADSRKLVLAFMLASALLSSIMSNMSVTAMFMGFCYTIFNQIKAKPGHSNLAKCLLIGIPMATMNGGMATPAGSSNNILVMGLYEQVTGHSISFLQWTAIGLPLAIVLTPISWFFITRILRPEPITEADLEQLHQKLQTGAFTAYDKKVLVFLIGLPVLWVIGNWVPALNVTLVSIVGLALMFVPGIDLVSWDEFQKGVPWTVVLMMGSVLSLGGILAKTGSIGFITDAFLSSSIMNLGIALIMLISFSFIYLTNSILPVGPALIGLFFAPLVGICTGAGLSAAIPGMVMAFTLSGSYLLPLNPNNLITYDGGYYTSYDVFKTGIIPSAIMMILCVVWVPFLTRLLAI